MTQVLHRTSESKPSRRSLLAFAAAAASLAIFATPAHAGITPTFEATDLSSAMGADSALVTSASFAHIPPGYYGVSPAASSDTSLASFATDGPSFAMLTTGDPRIADDANDSGSSGKTAGPTHFQGVDNYDVTVLRIDVEVPASDNCLSFDYRFLSEEFPEYVSGGYNDTFIAQLDRSDWYAGPVSVSAPGDFASDGTPIGVDSAGPYSVSADNATGTTYDAATELITARTPVSAGAHSVYFSIFDQGDPAYDSAAFLDNLSTTHETGGECASPDGSGPQGGSTPAGGGEGQVTGRPVRPAAPQVHIGTRSSIKRVSRRVRARALKRFNGTAEAEAGVARVEIALVGLEGAKASRRSRAPRCVRMNSRRQLLRHKPVASKCLRLAWLPVKGTKSWTYRLGRTLPAGTYVLHSRAIATDGSIEKSFSAASGNKISFTVY